MTSSPPRRYHVCGVALLWLSCCHGWATTTGGRQVFKVDVGSRRSFLVTSAATLPSFFIVTMALADETILPAPAADVQVTGDAKKLFNEARALESQGNMAAAQRLYTKVTVIAPRFVYGWSNLGNTQTALGDLGAAEESYSKAIHLCNESLPTTTEGVMGQKRCSDLWLLLLNRGSLRLNNRMPQEALEDLQQASTLRGRPDAIVLQNLARAKELNGLYAQADRDYTAAIGMTANEVNPFWLRSAMVKWQANGDLQGAYDLFKRVENRFPEAPEVRAASAVFLW